jgi:AraC-like DNA-binding protein
MKSVESATQWLKIFLINSEASNAEIALALGYTDATAFSHAFKRWSGMSPAQWREQHT